MRSLRHVEGGVVEADLVELQGGPIEAARKRVGDGDLLCGSRGRGLVFEIDGVGNRRAGRDEALVSESRGDLPIGVDCAVDGHCIRLGGLEEARSAGIRRGWFWLLRLLRFVHAQDMAGNLFDYFVGSKFVEGKITDLVFDNLNLWGD